VGRLIIIDSPQTIAYRVKSLWVGCYSGKKLYETALKKINFHAAIWSLYLSETGTLEISEPIL